MLVETCGRTHPVQTRGQNNDHPRVSMYAMSHCERGNLPGHTLNENKPERKKAGRS